MPPPENNLGDDSYLSLSGHCGDRRARTEGGARRCHPGLRASQLLCSPVSTDLGSALPLAQRAVREGGVIGRGRDSLVRGPLELPPTPAGTLSAACRPGAPQRPRHKEWVLEGPQMSPPHVPRAPSDPILRPLHLPGGQISPKLQSFPLTTWRSPHHSQQSWPLKNGVARDRSPAPRCSVKGLLMGKWRADAPSLVGTDALPSLVTTGSGGMCHPLTKTVAQAGEGRSPRVRGCPCRPRR